MVDLGMWVRNCVVILMCSDICLKCSRTVFNVTVLFKYCSIVSLPNTEPTFILPNVLQVFNRFFLEVQGFTHFICSYYLYSY